MNNVDYCKTLTFNLSHITIACFYNILNCHVTPAGMHLVGVWGLEEEPQQRGVQDQQQSLEASSVKMLLPAVLVWRLQ